MKFSRISLSAAALVVTIVGAFAFRSHTSRFLPGKLYTVNGTQHIPCTLADVGNPCPVKAYTVNGTQVTGAKATSEE